MRDSGQGAGCRLTVCALLAIGILSLPVPGANARIQRAGAARSIPTNPGMTVEDVIKLVRAGISEDIIIQQIRKRPGGFDLSTDQLIQLKSASVSDRIIQVMLDPSRAETPASSPPELASPAPPIAAAHAPPAPLTKHEISAPTEVGVYVRKADQWAELAPEVVYWKSAGVAKSVATLGVIKGNLNGHVIGPKSPNVHATPLEVLIVAPEGVAITEYQLVRLHVSKENRDFRSVTGGVFHAQSGAARDLVRFEGTKIAPRLFRVSFQSGLEPGEYGFLPPGSTGASGKIYSFHLTE
ncbi:MAG TPA: hypothetical protein VMH81_15185 [Bryobacteraceae bacterium]|nr:hypothetical protein [Bryobacteraceae bacterium]